MLTFVNLCFIRKRRFKYIAKNRMFFRKKCYFCKD